MVLFLALIVAAAQVLTPTVGVQIEVGAVAGSMPYLAPGSWVKYRVDWSAIETAPGVYDWSALDANLQPLQGWPLLLTVHNAPAWRRLLPGSPCSPIPPEQFPAYTAFVSAAVERYRPRAIELWNEPDAPLIPQFAHLFGCWGTPDLPHYGGERYAQMVSYACPRVKAGHPDVILLAGALMLDSEEKFDFASRISPQACDGLSFHFYPSAIANGADWDSIQTRIERLNALGHHNLWLTETSLLDAATPQQETLQADYFDYLLQDVSGIQSVFWYTLSNNGWRQSDMVSQDQPRQVWYRYTRALR